MPPKQTINRVLVRKLGVRRALLVESFIVMWMVYAATEGQDPERIEDLAEAIGKSRSRVFQWQSDFREAFPEWSTPRDLLDALGITELMNLRQLQGVVVVGG